ncbi:MAG: CHRD domain-containing protein [Pseudomonadota bacterium]
MIQSFYTSHAKALRTGAIATALALGAASVFAQVTPVELKGSNEVPPNTSKASGAGQILVNSDMTISGEITTSDIDASAAHIHEAAAGKNGPVIVPLKKAAEGIWSVPAGAKLTDAQYASYMQGNLYVNVHSAAFPGGEIRGQLIRK